MICPYCGAPSHELKVVETTHTQDQTRRRRACKLCRQKFSTVEVAVEDSARTSTKDILILPEGMKDALRIALTKKR